MSNLQPNCCLEFDFQKVDQHAGGKWLNHDTKRRKDNQLQSLKLPCRISKLSRHRQVFMITNVLVLEIEFCLISDTYRFRAYGWHHGTAFQNKSSVSMRLPDENRTLASLFWLFRCVLVNRYTFLTIVLCIGIINSSIIWAMKDI